MNKDLEEELHEANVKRLAAENVMFAMIAVISRDLPEFRNDLVEELMRRSAEMMTHPIIGLDNGGRLGLVDQMEALTNVIAGGSSRSTDQPD